MAGSLVKKRQRVMSIKKILALFVLSVLVSSLFVPTLAFADEETPEAQISANNQMAQLEGTSFAVDNFVRARVGSNRLINDEYFGYTFLSSDSSDSVAAVATADYIVVYIPPSSARAAGFNVDSKEDQAAFIKMIEALDGVSNRGGISIQGISTWYFTDEKEYQVGKIIFGFDQELVENQYYVTIIGEDGSDITRQENPLSITIHHADFANLVKIADLDFVAPAEGFDAFVEFLQNLDYRPLFVTLKTTGTAIIFIFILGLAAAYFCLRLPSRAQDIADAVFTIPMVLPPTVCGFVLLLLLGRNTALGQWFIDIGFPLIFSWQATVIAAVVVAFPLMYRSAKGAFEGLDPNLLNAARTLGWSNGKIFFKLMLPLSWSSIAAGTVLAFARALGEFGATLFIAGNFIGVTRTIPIAIYFEWMSGNVEVALFWTFVIIVVSFVVIIFINILSKRTTKYRRQED